MKFALIVRILVELKYIKIRKSKRKTPDGYYRNYG